jgi:fumarate reductase flavoprotein subunit
MRLFKTNVVVVGSGGAGMTAALTSAEGGAKVLLFEKRRTPGGTSNLPRGGIFAVESKMQLEKNYPFTKDQVFESFMDFTHWRVDAKLVRAFIDKSADTIEWLERQGVEFLELPSIPSPHLPGGYATGHPIKGQGAALMRVLRTRAEERGIEVHLATAVKKIVMDRGRVAGVMAEGRSGRIKVEAKAVVIATGGFSSNRAMMKKYCGFDLRTNLFPLFDLKLTGDGIKMAWEVGAAPDAMGPQLIFGIPGSGFFETQLPIIQGQPYLWINQEGERFINEEIIRNPVFAGNAIARQKNKCAFLIFDANTKNHMEQEGVDYFNIFFPDSKLNNLEGQIKTLIDKRNKNVFVADSLEALAKKIRVNPGLLRKTVEEYNRFCEKGHDDHFNKNPKYLRPVQEPRFYAFRIFPSMYGTLGGIKINERTEVLNKENLVIPGLYAAGYDACAIFGNPPDYNFYTPGSTFSFALNSGRMAGENALEYTKSIRSV